jgi:arginyl-tRNA synthetase
MILQNHAFLAVAIDNFGFIVIDGANQAVIEQVNFADYVPELGRLGFSIQKLLPVGDNGIRVMLKNDGAFTLFWRDICKINVLIQL